MLVQQSYAMTTRKQAADHTFGSSPDAGRLLEGPCTAASLRLQWQVAANGANQVPGVQCANTTKEEWPYRSIPSSSDAGVKQNVARDRYFRGQSVDIPMAGGRPIV